MVYRCKFILSGKRAGQLCDITNCRNKTHYYKSNVRIPVICNIQIQRGPRKGQPCGKKDCKKHNTSNLDNDDTNACTHIITRGKYKGVECGKTNCAKHYNIGVNHPECLCEHILARGKNKGFSCHKLFCPKHDIAVDQIGDRCVHTNAEGKVCKRLLCMKHDPRFIPRYQQVGPIIQFDVNSSNNRYISGNDADGEDYTDNESSNEDEEKDIEDEIEEQKDEEEQEIENVIEEKENEGESILEIEIITDGNTSSEIEIIEDTTDDEHTPIVSECKIDDIPIVEVSQPIETTISSSISIPTINKSKSSRPSNRATKSIKKKLPPLPKRKNETDMMKIMNEKRKKRDSYNPSQNSSGKKSKKEQHPLLHQYELPDERTNKHGEDLDIEHYRLDQLGVDYYYENEEDNNQRYNNEYDLKELFCEIEIEEDIDSEDEDYIELDETEKEIKKQFDEEYFACKKLAKQYFNTCDTDYIPDRENLFKGYRNEFSWGVYPMPMHYKLNPNDEIEKFFYPYETRQCSYRSLDKETRCIEVCTMNNIRCRTHSMYLGKNNSCLEGEHPESFKHYRQWLEKRRQVLYDINHKYKPHWYRSEFNSCNAKTLFHYRTELAKSYVPISTSNNEIWDTIQNKIKESVDLPLDIEEYSAWKIRDIERRKSLALRNL
jgi:hypothetical protein